MPKAISIRRFAKRVRVTEAAIRKGIRNGRMPKSIRGGKIVDVALAEREWRENRDPGHDFQSPSGLTTGLTGVRQREITARATKLEQDVARRAGTLVPAAEVEVRWSARVVAARTKLLGLPSRAKQRMPHLTAADLTELDRLVREALEELGTAQATA